jgi:spermidine synthase
MRKARSGHAAFCFAGSEVSFLSLDIGAPIYAIVVFLSAALLFVVEPMYGKMVLPYLGGSPSVWTTCVLFFQSVLLLGYLYAHLGPRWLGVRRHALIHLFLLFLGLIFLPLGVAGSIGAPRPEHPVQWLLVVLSVSMGVPFLLLSSTGPLVQAWFARTDSPSAANPYVLYAASNAGSLAALLAYPAAIEPTLTIPNQSRLWSVAYIVLVALVVGLLLRSWRDWGRNSALVDRHGESGAPSTEVLLRWTALAFVPSCMFLALTTYLSTDVAAVPLLWIIPLLLYLLSFMLVFTRRPPFPHAAVVRTQVILLVPVAIFVFWGSELAPPALAPFHLALLFVTGLVCHGELARARPSPHHLTQFYLCIAVGGMMGGVVNALVAPAMFDSVLEYPLILVIACIVRPRGEAAHRRQSRAAWDVGILFIAILAMAAVYMGSGAVAGESSPSTRAIILPLAVISSAFAAVASYRVSWDRYRLSVAIGMIVIAATVIGASRSGILFRKRNFFGVLEVRFDGHDSTHVMMHGNTKHGAQSLRADQRKLALSYYERHGPVGDLFRSRAPESFGRVAVVGLGTGAMAAYGQRGQEWTFYEIDPAVERVARDRVYFSYLADSPARIRVILGDARLMIAAAPDQSYNLLVLDAFSSDAIPVHLMTLEALRLYERKVSADGVIAFHLSNRYLDFEPVVARMAAAAGLVGRIRVDPGTRGALRNAGGDPSVWVVLGRDPDHLGRLWACAGWRPLETQVGVGLWTDGYSNIFSVVRAWAPVRAHKASIRTDGREQEPC